MALLVSIDEVRGAVEINLCAMCNSRRDDSDDVVCGRENVTQLALEAADGWLLWLWGLRLLSFGGDVG
jgi:hypothetical protein